LLSNRPTPCVLTCRRKQDRGRWRGDEEQRMTILRTGIVTGVEYVDLEDDIAGKVPRYGKTKRIISHHNFDETPEDLEKIHERLTKLDPDIVKIVTMANSTEDMVRMLKLVSDSKVPTIGFCMGELGQPSRVLCGKYGAPFTYATFSKDREMAPGQLSFAEMKNIYRYDQINAETQVFGVLGDPVAHSLSPVIHNAAFAATGLNAVYLPIRIFKRRLRESLESLDWLGIRGYSVTIPHKQGILEKADVLDEEVSKIGAANTLFREDNGQWHAANTDYQAALDSLEKGLKDRGDESPTIRGKKVLMLGAGGAARAIGWAMVHGGALLTIANRTVEKAKDLASELGCQFGLWEHRATGYADILINCTPMGMHPNVDESPFKEPWFREGMIVFDTVYTPENTLLVKQARERECHAISGLEMFTRQGAAQFERFTGKAPPLEVMAKALRRAISPVKQI
jgi:3-dehydroquinate dehydratase/shikimate dehydrogenase